MPTKDIKTIADVKNAIDEIVGDDIANYIFRGENESYEKISSTLYREHCENIQKLTGLSDNDKQEIINTANIPSMQMDIIEKAKSHFSSHATNVEIMTEIQHYGGKTNLIDFSENFLISLFFACSGETNDKDGVLYLLEKSKLKLKTNLENEDFEDDFLIKPNSKNNRVIFQSSIFFYSQAGYIKDSNYQKIPLPADSKTKILEELKNYHGIHEYTIYNDIHGFIQNRKNYKTAETYFYMGLAKAYSGHHQEAIETYTQGIELNSENSPSADLFANRGMARVSLEMSKSPTEDLKNIDIQQYKKSAEDFSKAIELNPQNLRTYNNRGIAYLRLGILTKNPDYYDLAIQDFNKTIDSDYANETVYKERGMVYSQIEKHDMAIKDFTKAIELNESDTMAYHSRGMSYFALQQYEKSKSDFQQAFKLEPQNEMYSKGIEHAQNMINLNQK